jgi:hypothetical protein
MSKYIFLLLFLFKKNSFLLKKNWTKQVELVGGGSVINGAYPV